MEALNGILEKELDFTFDTVPIYFNTSVFSLLELVKNDRTIGPEPTF